MQNTRITVRDITINATAVPDDARIVRTGKFLPRGAIA